MLAVQTPGLHDVPRESRARRCAAPDLGRLAGLPPRTGRERRRQCRDRRVHPVKKPGNGRALNVDTRIQHPCSGARMAGVGFALLTDRWRSLRHSTASSRRIGDVVKHDRHI
ncbi:hypothetical protein GCM10009565_46550 [Amycolatopsis albidoflavus]